MPDGQNISDAIKELRTKSHSCVVCGAPYEPCADMFHCAGCYDVDPHSVGCQHGGCLLADALRPLAELQTRLSASQGSALGDDDDVSHALRLTVVVAECLLKEMAPR